MNLPVDDLVSYSPAEDEINLIHIQVALIGVLPGLEELELCQRLTKNLVVAGLCFLLASCH